MWPSNEDAGTGEEMITPLTEKIWLVAGGRNGRAPFSHSLYIRDGGGFLIDAASDPDEIERLRKEEGISAVVMTHYHLDHTAFLHALPGTDVWTTQEDSPAFGSLETLLSWVGATGYEWEESIRSLYRDEYNFHPTVSARTVSDGEELRFGKTRAVALLAPGHTRGHLCLFFPDDGILFLGDYDLSAFGPVYADEPGDIEAFRRSARRLAAIGAETNVVSHGNPVHRGPISGKMEAYLSIIDRREEELRNFLREPRTRAEIIARGMVYGQPQNGEMRGSWEWSLLSRHLKGMIDRGETALQDGAYFLTR
jgi:hydroxyacylglutathione hydrolase